MKLKIANAIVALSLFLTPSTFAGGGGGAIVYDPTNWLQNKEATIKTILQLREDIKQSGYELQQIDQIYRLLGAADLDLTPAENLYNSRVRTLENQMNEVGGISYNVQEINSGLNALYPDEIGADGLTFAEYNENIANWRKTVWENIDNSFRAQAIRPVIEDGKISLENLLAANGNPKGNLEAIQISNQLLGLVVDQLLTLNQMMSQQFRAQSAIWARDEATFQRDQAKKERTQNKVNKRLEELRKARELNCAQNPSTCE